MAHPFAVAIVADKTRESRYVFLGSVNLKIEIRLDFKCLAEIGVDRRQRSIEIWIPDHNHLCISRYRLRTKPLGRDKSKERSRFFDAQFAVFDHALQRLPNSRVGKHVSIIKNQITAVGATDGTRLYQREVGKVTARDGFFFDDSDQVVVGGIGFDDDGQPLGVAVIDEHIHPIRQERVAGRFSHGHRPHGCHDRPGFDAFEALEILEDMVARRVEICDHLGVIAVLMFQVRQRYAN